MLQTLKDISLVLILPPKTSLFGLTKKKKNVLRMSNPCPLRTNCCPQGKHVLSLAPSIQPALEIDVMSPFDSMKSWGCDQCSQQHYLQ